MQTKAASKPHPVKGGGQMQVQITEERLRDSDPETGLQYSLGKGDIITVSSATGQRWCGYGWAIDVSGECPTGERIPGAREALAVHSATLGGK